MPLIHDFGVFVLAALALALLPGPDTLLAVGRTLAAGRRAGLLAVTGITAGCLVHVSAAALGITALIAASPLLFNVIKWIGALYLAWIGLQLVLTHARGDDAPKKDALGPQAAALELRRGFFTNVLNPKVGLFFISFLPQFLNPGPPRETAIAVVILGLTFVAIGVVWICFTVWFADAMARRARQSSVITLWMQRGVGALLVGVAAKLALSER